MRWDDITSAHEEWKKGYRGKPLGLHQLPPVSVAASLRPMGRDKAIERLDAMIAKIPRVADNFKDARDIIADVEE
jgi:hypothetical protein